MGYRHMCRFFTLQWVNALRRFEFVMRVDDDVHVHALHDDPLAILRRTDAVFGFSFRTDEKHELTRDTMPGWLRSHVRHRSMKPVRELNANEILLNNLFVARTDFWRRADVQRFLRHIDLSGNIYAYRWGDAPIQTAVLQLFAAVPPIYISANYSHLSTHNEIVTGSSESNGHDLGTPNSDESIRQDMLRKVPELMPLETSNVFRRFEVFFEGCLAPCLVANFFQLPGGPFVDEASATHALKQRVAEATLASDDAIEKLTTPALTAIVQRDIEGSAAPMPAESAVGVERRRALVRLLADALPDGAVTTSKSDLELVAAILNTSCCACWAPPGEINLNWRLPNNSAVDALSLAIAQPVLVANECYKIISQLSDDDTRPIRGGMSKRQSTMRVCEEAWGRSVEELAPLQGV